MASTITAKIAPLPRGNYSSSATYDKLDIVSYNGSSYMAIKAVPTGTAPTNTTYWQLLAEEPTIPDDSITDAKLVQSGGVLSEVHDIRIGADGTTYNSAGDAVRGQVGELNDVLDLQKVEPLNKIDLSAITEGYQYNWQGNFVVASNRNTTDYIPVKKGDVLWFFTTVNNEGNLLLRVNCERLVEFDEDKSRVLLSGQYPFTSTTTPNGNNVYQYVVQNDDAAFLRISYNSSYSYPSLYVNAADITYTKYVSYFEPYIISKVIDDLTSEIHRVNTHIIDCWGDSRTAMIASQGTAFADYLQTSLGDTYIVCNYGASSQSSGMCAARLGSNEVFVTLTNNQIPASGEVQLTGIKCSTGNIKNLYAYSPTEYIPCVINGVPGRLSKASQSDYSNVKFLRDSSGSVVGVKPRTKIVVDDMNSKHHMCILWWGKNDFASAVPYVESGILDNYEKAVEYIGHDKFIILGETCSINESYEEGGTNRTYLQNINSALAATYPNNYIDINAYLSSEQALTDVGLTATADDLAFIAKGFPCYQLMVYSTDSSDTVHPNEYGRQAIAHKIYAWMQEKGWV